MQEEKQKSLGRYLFDIETYPNFFCATFLDYNTNEYIYFEISEYQNDLNALLNFVKNKIKYLINFNGNHYDNIHLYYLFKEKGIQNVNEKLYNITQQIIQYDNYEFYKKYKYQPYELTFKSIDLYLFWSKMLRQSKMLSLKSLAVQLNFHNIQELPFKYDTVLTREQMLLIKNYNINDVNVLKMLFDKMKEEVNLRRWINTEYGLECYSMDAPKIASEILATEYADKTNQTIKEVTNQNFSRPTLVFKELLKDIDFEFKLPVYKNLYEKILNSINTFSEKIYVDFNNTTILSSYGVGGLHSTNKNEIYKSNEKYCIITSDIQSLYPQLYIEYSCIRFPEVLEKLKQIKHDRVEAKKTKNKLKDSFLKLCLNAVSGMLDNEYSWLYYPEGAMRMRILGQLILTKLTEEAILIGGKVISQNTDGVEIIFERTKLDEYYEKVKEIETQYKVIFEHDFYKKIVYSTVNDYIAITETDKIKKKGLFVTEPVLGNSTDFLIIPKALEAYFVKGISPEEFIKNHNDIYDFCAANKISKAFQVIWMGKIQQQLNRYFVSRKGGYLYKKKEGKNMENVLKGYAIQLFNKYEEKEMKDYNIDYDFYIKKVKEIIDDLEPKQKNLFA